MTNKHFLFVIILSVIASIGIAFKIQTMDIPEEFQEAQKNEYKAEKNAIQIRRANAETHKDKVERYMYEILDNFYESITIDQKVYAIIDPMELIIAGLEGVYYSLHDVDAIIEAYDKAINKYFFIQRFYGPAPAQEYVRQRIAIDKKRSQFYIKDKPELKQYVYAHAQ